MRVIAGSKRRTKVLHLRTPPKRYKNRGRNPYPVDSAVRRTTNVLRHPTPLMPKLKATLLYGDQYTINNAVVNQVTSRVFVANGLFDPDSTGVGHQPRGFDQIMAMYDHYVVIGSKITVWPIGDNTANQVVCYIRASDTAAADVDPDNPLEYQGTVLTVVPSRGRYCDPISSNVNPAKFLGRSKPLSDPELKGSASANPAEQVNWIVGTWLPGSTAAGDTFLNVRIEYEVIFIEPKLPAKS